MVSMVLIVVRGVLLRLVDPHPGDASATSLELIIRARRSVQIIRSERTLIQRMCPAGERAYSAASRGRPGPTIAASWMAGRGTALTGRDRRSRRPKKPLSAGQAPMPMTAEAF